MANNKVQGKETENPELNCDQLEDVSGGVIDPGDAKYRIR